VQDAVVELFPVTAAQLTGRSRSRTVCRARQTAIYLSRRLTGASLAEIGRFYGGLAHTTVKYSVARIESASRSDPQLSDLIRQMEGKLGGR
jgi:chromosomal replication initiator protein